VKTKLFVAVVCTALLGALPASATTYQYNGPLYSEFINTTTPPFDFAAAAAGPSLAFGPQMTGQVVFDFDTTGVTGTYPFFAGGSISSLQLTSGSYTVAAVGCSYPSAGCLYDGGHNPIGFGEVFYLTNGAITSWLVQVSSGLLSMATSGSGGGPAGLGNCGPVPCSGIVVSNSGDFANLVTWSNGDGPLAETSGGLRGEWSTASSATPLPAALPLFAAGLGALGLIGWRRKRKDAAA
jgi:hypothetical protein